MSHQTKEKPPIVVDGSNIAWLVKTPQGKPKVANILSVRDRLQKLGYRPIIIVDAALVHEVRNDKKLNHLVDSGEIKQAPAHTDGDYFVLKTAELEHAKIISDDLYRDYRNEFLDIEQKLVPVMIVDGNVELYHLAPASSNQEHHGSKSPAPSGGKNQS